MNEIIVIGGGAAGLAAAVSAAEGGAHVILLEKMARCGRKICITGKGRCNVTTDKTHEEIMAAIRVNSRFMFSSLAAFDNRDVADFFESRGCPLKVERGGRVFPESDHARDIVDALVKAAESNGVDIRTSSCATDIAQRQDGFVVSIENALPIEAQAIIIATGGLSYPLTGSSGDGHVFARRLGIKVTPVYPALVPLISTESWISELAGLSLRNVDVTVKGIKGKVLYSERGEMLFTHFGLSGPVILSASGHCAQYWMKNKTTLTVHIDLKPALSEKQLDARLIREIEAAPKKHLQNMLKTLLPHKLIPIFIKCSGLSVQTAAGELTREERRTLLNLMKDFTVTVSGTRPVSEAIVTSGGISVREIDPKTMAVKEYSGLYACGELLDLDAYTGGFNLQIAFSTGHAAGKAACSYVGH